MKKYFALVLVAAMLFTTLAGCGEPTEPTKGTEAPTQATETEPEETKSSESLFVDDWDEPWNDVDEEALERIPVDRETAQQAIIETALAYYRKNPNMQYDARSLTTQKPQENAARITQYMSPEYVSDDQTHFSQCTQFALDILNNTFGWHFFKDIKEPHTNPSLQWERYNGGVVGAGLVYRKDATPANEIDAVVNEYVSLLQPGDLIVSFGTDSGHLMMYLGDCLGDGTRWVIHCWGGSIEYEAGFSTDKWEDDGSIYMQSVEELCMGQSVSGKPNWDLHKKAGTWMGIFRFLDDPDFKCEVLPSAMTRLKYRRMTVDSYVEGKTQYSDIPQGEPITLVTSITNYSDEAYKDVPVRINLPEKGLEPIDGAQTEFTVDVQPGETVLCKCTCMVTKTRSSMLKIPTGTVGDIRTRQLEFKVSGKQFTEEQQNAITKAGMRLPKEVKGTELAFVKSFYKEVLGMELDLPDTAQELMDLVFKKKVAMLQIKDRTEENEQIFRGAIREMISGHNVD